MHHIRNARIGPIDLVDDENHRQVQFECLAEHEARLGQRPLGGIDEKHDAVHHRESPFDLTAEVGVSRRVHDIDLDRRAVRQRPAHGSVLGLDRDSLLAFEVEGVHHPVGIGSPVAHGSRLLEQGVHEGCLAVVDVGHDGHVAQVIDRHGVLAALGSGGCRVGHGSLLGRAHGRRAGERTTTHGGGAHRDRGGWSGVGTGSDRVGQPRGPRRLRISSRRACRSR